MQYFKKGTLVFVHTQSYPPWPAQVQRKYDNGLYKVNFIGQKSYTRIQLDKMDLFTEQRAKQVHSQLEDKKLSKAIFVALKQFQNRKKRGQLDHQLVQLLKKPLPLLDLSMFKNNSMTTMMNINITNHNNNKNINIINTTITTTQQQLSKSTSKQTTSLITSSIQSINNNNNNSMNICPLVQQYPQIFRSSDENIEQISVILDKICQFMLLPVKDKMKPFITQLEFIERKNKIDFVITRLKALFIKEQEDFNISNNNKNKNNINNNNNINSSNISQSKPHLPSIPILSKSPCVTYKRVYSSSQPGLPGSFLSKQSFIQKLTTYKIIQKIIITLKTYESFRQQSRVYFEQLSNYLKEKFSFYYEKFKEENNGKKNMSQKDKIMMEKFQNFVAYL